MRLWRLTLFPRLEGAGGLLASARWHAVGRPVIYTAPSPEGALLEVRVHLDVQADEIPEGYRLLAVDVPPGIPVEEVTSLPPDWQRDDRATRAIGDAWLESRRSLLLRVPSAILPHTSNYLINLRHERMAEVRLAIDEPYSLPTRLFPRPRYRRRSR